MNNTDFYGYDDYEGYFNYYSDYLYEYLPETSAALFISRYMLPLLLLFGTFGNPLAFIAMYRLSREVSSACVYLAVLAVVDILVLYRRCGNDWLVQITGTDLSQKVLSYSSTTCKVFSFVWSFVDHLSTWLTVTVAVEGFSITMWPNRLAKMGTRCKAKDIIILLTVLLTLHNVHYFWSFDLVVLDILGPNTAFCTFSDANFDNTYIDAFRNAWPLMNLLVGDVVPYLVVLICGMMMLVRIGRGRHRGNARHQAWRARYVMDPAALDQIALLCLILSLSYLVLVLPKVIFSIVTYVAEKYELFIASFETAAKQELAETIGNMLEDMFFSMKCCIYLAFSQRFRRELKNACICTKRLESQSLRRLR